jgi:hypothetical protein
LRLGALAGVFIVSRKRPKTQRRETSIFEIASISSLHKRPPVVYPGPKESFHVSLVRQADAALTLSE